jgi:hypothetical protein
MRRQVTSLFALLCLAAGLLQVPVALRVRAQSPTTPPLTFTSTAPLLPPPGFDPAVEPLAVMIQLAAPPALLAGTSEAVISQHTRNSVDQTALEPALRALGVQELFRVRLVYNGIAVVIPRAQLAALQALPGVAAVHTIVPKRRLDQPASTPVATSTEENRLLGATGQGVSIGVIDSGVDYTHANFGGPGTERAYRANNPTLIESGSFPTNKVIGGYDFAGETYDASGLNGSLSPVPDPDPLDCRGDGTRVAGVAAGFGVTAGGARYQGAYMSRIDARRFRVPPGVAPEASIYAFKVFGCSAEGTTALLTQAVERALDPNGDGDPADRVDILNVTSVAPFGGSDDPDAVAVNNAVQAGIVVVTAAGDTGNTFYALHSPAGAQRAISVGASVGASSATPTEPVGSLFSLTARGPQRGGQMLKPDLVAPGVGERVAAFGSGSEARIVNGSAIAAAYVTGAAALLRQLNPGWTLEQIKYALVNTASSLRTAEGREFPPSLVGAGQLDLSRFERLDMRAYPAGSPEAALSFGAPWLAQPWQETRLVQLENASDVNRTVAFSATVTAEEAGVSITLPPGPITLPPNSQVTLPVSLTVQPQALDFTPDWATPLQQNNFPRHYLAEHGGYIQFASRSSNSPRVRIVHSAQAGRLAVDLAERRIEGAINPGSIGPYRPIRSGANTVEVRKAGDPRDAPPLVELPVNLQQGQDYTIIVGGALQTLGIALVEDQPPSPSGVGQALIHFVNANFPGPNADSGPLDVYLNGNVQVTALQVGQATGYTPVASGTYVVAFYRSGVPPSAQSLVAQETVTLAEGDALLVGAGQWSDPDHCDGQDSAICKAEQRAFAARTLARPAPDVLLRVPFQVFPKAAAASRVTSASIGVPVGATSVAIDVQNTGARADALNPTGPNPRTPLVSAFELVGESPPLLTTSMSLRAADVQYLGVSSDAVAARAITDTTVFFGLSTYGPWSTPNEVQFRIYLDVNLDGINDYVLLNSNWGSATGSLPSDVFVSPLYTLLPDGAIRTTPINSIANWNTLPAPSIFPYLDAAPYNTSVMFQAVSARFLGLSPTQTRVRYHLEARARDADNFTRVVDRVPETGAFEYDVMRGAVSPVNVTTPALANRPLFVDITGERITGFIDSALLGARGAQKLVVLHHHNPPGSQAEVVELRYGALRMFMPLVSKVSGGQGSGVRGQK